MDDSTTEEVICLTYEVPRKVFRYLLDDGHVVDVVTSHNTSSDERVWVIREAKKRWKRDVQIKGVTEIKDAPGEEGGGVVIIPRRGLFDTKDVQEVDPSEP